MREAERGEYGAIGGTVAVLGVSSVIALLLANANLNGFQLWSPLGGALLVTGLLLTVVGGWLLLPVLLRREGDRHPLAALHPSGKVRGRRPRALTAAEWTADWPADELFVRTFVETRFPQLAELPLRKLAEGWDNAVWLAGDQWTVRIPRRKVALPGIERELMVLPRLAPLLPLQIPVPEEVARDAAPLSPITVARLVSGREAGEAALDDEQKTALGLTLGGFLRTLHATSTLDAVADLEIPVDPLGRANPQRRAVMARRRLDEIVATGLWVEPPTAAELLAAVDELDEPPATALVHGDLHFRHIIVDDEGVAVGVIDWGDIAIADPCVDLQLAWSFLPPPAREAFLASYGSVTERQALLARAIAVSLSCAIALHARDLGSRHMFDEAIAGLDSALAG